MDLQSRKAVEPFLTSAIPKTTPLAAWTYSSLTANAVFKARGVFVPEEVGARAELVFVLTHRRPSFLAALGDVFLGWPRPFLVCFHGDLVY